MFVVRRRFDVYGRAWEATFAAPSQYLSSRRTFSPWILLIVLTLLLVTVMAGRWFCYACSFALDDGVVGGGEAGIVKGGAKCVSTREA